MQITESTYAGLAERKLHRALGILQHFQDQDRSLELYNQDHMAKRWLGHLIYGSVIAWNVLNETPLLSFVTLSCPLLPDTSDTGDLILSYR